MNEIYDILYCTKNEAKQLLDKYPDAKTKDASDFVHECRFEITLSDTRKNYFKNVIDAGLSTVSLNLRIAMRSEEDSVMLDEILKEINKSYEK